MFFSQFVQTLHALACVRARGRACVGVCVRACVCVRASVCARLCVCITAVAYPEWDGLDAKWYPVPALNIYKTIKSQGSLWDLTIDDPSHNFFLPNRAMIDR